MLKEETGQEPRADDGASAGTIQTERGRHLQCSEKVHVKRQRERILENARHFEGQNK
jgi:hypothetical protein